jgi:hypothetical protein
VQEPPAVRDLLLLFDELVDLCLEIGVGHRREIGKRFQVISLSFGEGGAGK